MPSSKVAPADSEGTVSLSTRICRGEAGCLLNSLLFPFVLIYQALDLYLFSCFSVIFGRLFRCVFKPCLGLSSSNTFFWSKAASTNCWTDSLSTRCKGPGPKASWRLVTLAGSRKGPQPDLFDVEEAQTAERGERQNYEVHQNYNILTNQVTIRSPALF